MELLFMASVGVAAVLMDLHGRKIPNPLIVSGGLLALSWQWCSRGAPGLESFLGGAALPLAVLAPLHYFRMLGAGDVKLLMVFGGFLGPLGSLRCICYSFLIAAVFSVAVLIKHCILVRRLNYFVQYIRDLMENRKWKPYIREEEDESYLHFSIPVVISGLYMLGGIL